MNDLIEIAVLVVCRLFRGEDEHDVRSAVHDAYLKMTEEDDVVLLNWLIQAAKKLLGKRRVGRLNRERMRVPMPPVVEVPTRLESRSYPVVVAAFAALTRSQRAAARMVIAGDPLQSRRLILDWENAAAKLRRRLTPAGEAATTGPGTSVRSRAIAAGVSPHAVGRRMRGRGMSLEEAIQDVRK